MNLIIIAVTCWLLWLVFRKKKPEITSYQEKTLSAPTISIEISSDYTKSAPRTKTAVSPDSVWVPKGKSITVSGYTINDGLLYFGSGLTSASGWGVEPALINPDLPIDKFVIDTEGKLMRYWPSYSEIGPQCRAAYLHWLSSGKNNPDAYIGYVFLYFYGLERRMLADTLSSESAKAETGTIIEEVKRLLSIYGKDGSFNNYARNFIDFVQSRNPKSKLYEEHPPQVFSPSYEVPLSIQIAFAQAARDNAPLAAAWALAAVKSYPMRNLRTPAHRCENEFNKLFSLRYNRKYGDGLKLSPGKRKMKFSYRPASASFGREISFSSDDLPNVIGLEGQISSLFDIAEECTNELDAYSRFLGRKPEERNTLEALSLLPDGLIEDHKSNEVTTFMAWLQTNLKESDPCTVDFSMLLSFFLSIDAQNIRKQGLVSLSQVLAKFNIGMEPDIRFGSPKPASDQSVVLFTNPGNAPVAPSHAYSIAAVILQLGAIVSASDEKISAEEERHLETQLETWLHLSLEEKSRLRAFTRWILSVPTSFSGMKNKIALFSEKQCETVGKFLVSMAQADGIIDALEIKTLSKIYKMLGLDVQALYSHAHSAASAPVTIAPGDVSQKVFSIPSAPEKKSSDAVDLDMESIKVKMAETAAVTALLSDIFADEEAELIKPLKGPVEEVVDSIAGLDAEHSAFARILAGKPSWTRSDLEALAAQKELLLDGALDSINDAVIEALGGPLFDGDDPIEIDSAIAKEILL